ncbi:frataxin homolog, mitochondrial [Drosophila virilis]|uniref:ferroxidase n=1 Tax=Drosophila virilis TaxID=7244 RepID=B4MET9_DROVI|nr:frataxin homolog, mitochondrial [Drosophila virilis]EDW63064.2 uncharacterized protein Dvir_GJ14708 [Drosophila virilis]
MNRIRICLRTAVRRHGYRCAPGRAPFNISAMQLATGSNNCSSKQELQICRFCSNLPEPEYVVDDTTYDRVCSETLDALSDYFDELTENAAHITGSDVVYGDGVLSVNLGPVNGMYVINRQKPNKQIWLSSPVSGPKRFDYIVMPGEANGRWVYKHTGVTLHEMLQEEIAQIFREQPVNFLKLP